MEKELSTLFFLKLAVNNNVLTGVDIITQHAMDLSTFKQCIALLCCITFFYQLTDIAVIVLQKAIAEAMSNIREHLRVFHQILRSLHQPFCIASDFLDISNPDEYADICY